MGQLLYNHIRIWNFCTGREPLPNFKSPANFSHALARVLEILVELKMGSLSFMWCLKILINGDEISPICVWCFRISMRGGGGDRYKLALNLDRIILIFT